MHMKDGIATKQNVTL